MDISSNKIDLLYLSNSVYLNKYNKKVETVKNINNEIDFYKKRIFQITKDLLRKKPVDTKIQDAFNNFVGVVIEYFKFNDTMEIYQKEYKDISIDKKKPNINFELMDTNKLMTKEIKFSQKTIKEIMNIQSNKKKHKLIIPSKKNIEINTDEYKNKGVKEKSK
jgi:hypothetical protein